MKQDRFSEPYIFDSEMMKRFQRAGSLCAQYNNTGEDEKQKRRAILDELLGKCGRDVLVVPGFRCEYGDNIELDDNVIINFNCTLMDNTTIHIGSHTLLGPNCSLYTVNHALHPDEREQGYCANAPIHIGSRVWLGGDTVVLAGVTIGDGSVIGAGSVVTKDIPAGVVAAGNPCRVIRPIAPNDKWFK